MICACYYVEGVFCFFYENAKTHVTASLNDSLYFANHSYNMSNFLKAFVFDPCDTRFSSVTVHGYFSILNMESTSHCLFILRKHYTVL